MMCSLSKISRVYSCSIKTTDVDIIFFTKWLDSSGCHYIRSSLLSSNKS